MRAVILAPAVSAADSSPRASSGEPGTPNGGALSALSQASVLRVCRLQPGASGATTEMHDGAGTQWEPCLFWDGKGGANTTLTVKASLGFGDERCLSVTSSLSPASDGAGCRAGPSWRVRQVWGAEPPDFLCSQEPVVLKESLPLSTQDRISRSHILGPGDATVPNPSTPTAGSRAALFMSPASTWHVSGAGTSPSAGR